jgi:hypothetical protein
MIGAIVMPTTVNHHNDWLSCYSLLVIINSGFTKSLETIPLMQAILVAISATQILFQDLII